MTADTAVFLQSVPAVASLLSKQGNEDSFRIFSKLGAGYSSSRQVGEIVSNAYLCLPSTDNGGAELTVTVRGSVASDYDLSKVEQHVYQAMEQATTFALQHA